MSLLEIMYKLTSSADIITKYITLSELEEHCKSKGFGKEELGNITDFIDKNVTEHEYNKTLREKSLEDYVDSLLALRTYIEVAKGYTELSNLKQTEETLWDERETKLDEMDKKDTEEKSKSE